ncbi:hypothetical protein E4Q23_21850 [Candidatus Accumulibacter phosphatis]|jgi:hypothetical protein|uniref:Uncharacterized protein n=1 Tax=Candidatus Accumulibacter phosphatis TaxID=327160 RepID=A0ABX1U0Z1_9PROT|nr:hypothetical protein [Candidatus Accumulibacter phosphatis]NMQ30166.1 hypothetical protein [Candidatus Accumulibacter phosphatis]
MNEKPVIQTVREFSKSGDQRFNKSFFVSGNTDEIITVTIERTKQVLATKSLSFEARANTISALPSGAPCGCCGGSGKAD